MLLDFICVKFKTSKTNIQWQKPKCWWLWGRGCLLPGMEQKGSFAMKKCSIPCCGEGYKGVSYINIHWIVHLRFVHFAVYTLYLNWKKKRYGPKVRSWSYSFYGGFYPPLNKQTNKNKWGLRSLTRVADRNLRPILALPGKARQIKGHTLQDSQQSQLRL